MRRNAEWLVRQVLPASGKLIGVLVGLLTLGTIAGCGGSTGDDESGSAPTTGGATASGGAATSGGATATGGVAVTGGSATGGSASGGAPPAGGAGTGGATIDCSMVGCAAPPRCDDGCREPCGCCFCREGEHTELDGIPHVCTNGCWAVDDADCDPATEFWRDYVGTVETCPLIHFACPAGATPFGNPCGCGCEQSRDCPEWLDCMPGGAPPVCGDLAAYAALCPYTDIAF